MWDRQRITQQTVLLKRGISGSVAIPESSQANVGSSLIRLQSLEISAMALDPILWAFGSAFWFIFPFSWKVVCVCSWDFSVCLLLVNFRDAKTFFHLVLFLSLSVQTSSVSADILLKTVDSLCISLTFRPLDKNYTNIFRVCLSLPWASAEG